ncbi:MAG: tRNA pseudouridine(55) synthase TruB [Spirochaetales bacterium]|nr:tRNA pseudouridine(55) synthase TruB [Spirochaetales bacterium]
MGTTPSILLVNKESGKTSFSSLWAIKRLMGKKVGHAGTLDKFAQGLLIVLTGPMTRLNPLFSNMDKRYRASIRFGTETDTLDPEGEIVATAALPSFEEIKAALPAFQGTVQQVPPSYSALHVDGQRASDRVRSGEVVEMKSRPVTIYSFELLSYEDGLLVADIFVSKGTYIRSIARDLGKACGSCAHLEALVRTEIGPFFLEEAIKTDDPEALVVSQANTASLLGRVDAMGRAECGWNELARLANGIYPPSVQIRPSDKYVMLFDPEGTLRAILDPTVRKIICHVAPYRPKER